VRVVSLHTDVILLTSEIWQTNCTIVHAGEECFMIDSPILPQELHALPAVLEQAGLHLSGLLATHGDWDHLLGRVAFPQVSLGCAQSTSQRLLAASGQPQRELRAFDEQHYLERNPPLALGQLQALPVPGRLGIGPHELELHTAEGHTVDGMAIWIPWAKVLVAGDYLSCIEIPFFGEGHGTLEAYRATLAGLRPLVQIAEHVVPGHGPVLDGARATAVLEEDLAYLASLEIAGAQAQLPPGRRSKTQRQLHAQNVAAIGAATAGGSSAIPPAAG
jgi:glyoxylase-like metal-dependent hydrolase (beta-lactamase superfamily II)